MTTFAGASLSDGQVASSIGAIYTCPSATVVHIGSVTFYNNSATTQTLVVSVTRSGGTARKLRQFSLAQNESGQLIDGPALVLSAGDTLNAVTTTATEVDYLVTGVTAA